MVWDSTRFCAVEYAVERRKGGKFIFFLPVSGPRLVDDLALDARNAHFFLASGNEEGIFGGALNLLLPHCVQFRSGDMRVIDRSGVVRCQAESKAGSA